MDWPYSICGGDKEYMQNIGKEINLNMGIRKIEKEMRGKHADGS
jgi:hypothetical protein